MKYIYAMPNYIVQEHFGSVLHFMLFNELLQIWITT